MYSIHESPSISKYLRQEFSSFFRAKGAAHIGCTDGPNWRHFSLWRDRRPSAAATESSGSGVFGVTDIPHEKIVCRQRLPFQLGGRFAISTAGGRESLAAA